MDIEALRGKSVRYVIGLMSGTSCDGVDAALVRIKGTGPEIKVKFLQLHAFPYPPELREKLLNPKWSAKDVCLMNFALGERFAEAVLATANSAKEAGYDVDFVASHGHTVAHYPPRTSSVIDQPCGTLQVGEAAVIAERTGLPVVSNFRPRDMAAGGQGAPLVPYADWVMFNRSDRTVACLNIGGIANFTVVTPEFDGVCAFDSGPGNMIIDGAVAMLSKGAATMDQDGVLASKGIVIDALLEELMAHPYFERRPPKSTGREEFGPDIYLREALKRYAGSGTKDLIATCTAVVVKSIVQAFDRYIRPHHIIARVIISGGGAYNRTLVRGIADGLPDAIVRASDAYGIPSNAREAVAFAILGNEAMCGTPANVPRATGARHNVLLGTFTFPS